MSEIKIKVTQNVECYDNEVLDPHVVKILNGKRHLGPNESVLSAVCEGIVYFLHRWSNWSFRYEKNSKGHFFIIDEEALNDPKIQAFNSESIHYERVSFLD